MNRTTTRAGVAAGVATGLAGLAGVLGAVAPATATAPSTSTVSPSAPTSSVAPRTTVEQQTGIVLECAGDGVQVTVYENSRYGNSVTLVVGDPELGHFAYGEQAAPYVVDGVLSAAVEVDGAPATVTGTVTPNGRPTRIVETMQDGGEQLVTRGTNAPLATSLVAHVAADDVPLECAPAYAFDLEVRRTALYGN
jgi:hypothetical protein